MMKLCGIAFIMLLFVLASARKAMFYRTRCKQLLLCVELVDGFERQIAYSAATTREIMEQFSMQGRFSDLHIVSDCVYSMKSGMPFPQAFEQSCLASCDTLNEEERRLLCSFGQSIGRSDADGDIKCCKHYSRELLRLLKQAQEQQKIKGGLTMKLGVLAAAGAFALLI